MKGKPRLKKGKPTLKKGKQPKCKKGYVLSKKTHKCVKK